MGPEFASVSQVSLVLEKNRQHEDTQTHVDHQESEDLDDTEILEQGNEQLTDDQSQYKDRVDSSDHFWFGQFPLADTERGVGAWKYSNDSGIALLVGDLQLGDFHLFDRFHESNNVDDHEDHSNKSQN